MAGGNGNGVVVFDDRVRRARWTGVLDSYPDSFDRCGHLCCGCDNGVVGNEGVRLIISAGCRLAGGDGNGVVVFDNRRRARVVGWMAIPAMVVSKRE